MKLVQSSFFLALVASLHVCKGFHLQTAYTVSDVNRVHQTRTTSLNLFSFGNREEENASLAAANDEDDSWTDFGKNPLTFAYAGAWASLVAFAFFFAPGELSSPKDTAMLQAIIDNPSSPEGVNPFFYGIFNIFAIIPIVLGQAISPRARSDKGIPAAPPLFLSTFIAYFVMGPYLALRKTPKTEVETTADLDWVTRNIWENKIVNYGTIAFGLLCLVAGAAPGFDDPVGNFNGMIEYVQSSRFASVSFADLSLITLILTKEVADDYKIRCNPENLEKAPLIGASTALLPLLGTAIYCALRPSLPEAEE